MTKMKWAMVSHCWMTVHLSGTLLQTLSNPLVPWFVQDSESSHIEETRQPRPLGKTRIITKTTRITRKQEKQQNNKNNKMTKNNQNKAKMTMLDMKDNKQFFHQLNHLSVLFDIKNKN